MTINSMPKNLFTYLGAPPPPIRDCPVFLPGWGFDGRITSLAAPPRSWLTTSHPAGPADILAELDETLTRFGIESIVLVGWSLGAYLALDFAADHPEKVSALYLLAGRDYWPPAEIEAIRQGISADQDGFLSSFYRKCFLGYRQAGQAFRERLEEQYLATLSPEILNAGLDYLNDMRLAPRLQRLAGLDLPIYLLEGAKDIIAPPADAPAIAGPFRQLFRHGGHPLFLEADFDPEQHRRKATIRRKFSRAATTYDAHATVQRETAAKLATSLPETAPATILELGCGTGNYTRLLIERFPSAHLTALDFAAAMLAVARAKVPGEQVTFHWQDAELYLKNSPESYDLITANATLQWFDDLGRTAGLIRERLNPGGTFLATIFGPEGLPELHAGLAAVNPGGVSMPSDTFPDQTRLQAIFSPHFAQIEIEEWRLLRHYPTLADLLRHIRRTGTSGPRQGAPLLDRPRFAALEKWFRQEFGECRVSYQIFLIRCSQGEPG
ncbi:MAG: alpha/beta fold hydrolase [Desulfobulbaceae bacterium]|nr:alpha/beta fold hydrolase [Desulfobulbaceae bacterium]